LVDLTAPLVFFFTPAVIPVTSTTTVHFEPTAIDPPVSETPRAPADAVAVPPHLLISLFWVETTNPDGSVSANTTSDCATVGKPLLATLPDAEIDARLTDPLPQLTSHSIGTKAELRKALDQVREVGYALDNEEMRVGRCCVAVVVPAPELHGGTGALSVTTSPESSRERREELLAAIFDGRRRLTLEANARHYLGDEPPRLPDVRPSKI
jgi:hypothetical protein